MTPNRNSENDVNDSIQTLERVAFGRGRQGSFGRQQAKSLQTEAEIKRERLNIGTWNIRTMARPGKLANVIGEMRRAELDILGLAEVIVVIVIVIVISKLLKRHSKAKRRAPAYSRALRLARWVVQKNSPREV